MRATPIHSPAGGEPETSPQGPRHQNRVCACTRSHVMVAALADDLLQRPGFHLPLFEAAALEAAVSMAIVDEAAGDLPAFQITLTSSKQPTTIRQLLSSQVSRVVMIPGIVISASRVKAKVRSRRLLHTISAAITYDLGDISRAGDARGRAVPDLPGRDAVPRPRRIRRREFAAQVHASPPSERAGVPDGPVPDPPR